MLHKMKLVHCAFVFLFLDLCWFGYNYGSEKYAHIYRLILLNAAGICLLMSVINNPVSVKYLFKNVVGIYTIFAIFSIASFGYSSHPGFTAFKGFEVFLLGLSIAVLVGMKNSQENMMLAYLLIIRLISIVLLVMWGYAILFPDLTFIRNRTTMGFMMGGLMNPNALGSISAIILIHNFSLISKTTLFPISKKVVFFFILSLVTVILAYSRTSIIGAVVAIAAMCLVGRKVKLTISFLILLLVTIFSFSGSIAKDIGLFLARGQSDGSLEGMSGRVNGWEIAIKYWQESPLIGHGYMSAGRYDVLDNTSSHLHGSVIELLVGLGVIGLFLWLVLIIFTGIKILKRTTIISKRQSTSSFYDGLFALYIFLLIRSFTSSVMVMHSMELMVFSCAMGFAVIKNQKQQ